MMKFTITITITIIIIILIQITIIWIPHCPRTLPRTSFQAVWSLTEVPRWPDHKKDDLCDHDYCHRNHHINHYDHQMKCKCHLITIVQIIMIYDHHPLIWLLEGEDEGVDISQVIFQEINQLVNVRLLHWWRWIIIMMIIVIYDDNYWHKDHEYGDLFLKGVSKTRCVHYSHPPV